MRNYTPNGLCTKFGEIFHVNFFFTSHQRDVYYFFLLSVALGKWRKWAVKWSKDSVPVMMDAATNQRLYRNVFFRWSLTVLLAVELVSTIGLAVFFLSWEDFGLHYRRKYIKIWNSFWNVHFFIWLWLDRSIDRSIDDDSSTPKSLIGMNETVNDIYEMRKSRSWTNFGWHRRSQHIGWMDEWRVGSVKTAWLTRPSASAVVALCPVMGDRWRKRNDERIMMKLSEPPACSRKFEDG